LTLVSRIEQLGGAMILIPICRVAVKDSHKQGELSGRAFYAEQQGPARRKCCLAGFPPHTRKEGALMKEAIVSHMAPALIPMVPPEAFREPTRPVRQKGMKRLLSLLLIGILVGASLGAFASFSQPQKALACGWVVVGGTQDWGGFYLKLWDYTCDGGYHVQLIAKEYACFNAVLYANDYSIVAASTLLYHLSAGQYINTNTSHGYSNYQAWGGEWTPDSC
jgi:hypothetical protein